MTAFPETIPALLEWRTARAPSAPWLHFQSDSWTLEDFAAEVDRHAVGLVERGVAPGDRVAILLGNRPETLFAWFAANRLGAIAMPLNRASKAPELTGALALARPRVLIADDHRALAIAASDALSPDARPSLVSPAELSRAGCGAPKAEIAPDDVAVLLTTSGTTGAPKGVMVSHRTYTLSAEAFPFWVGLTGADRLLVALPLFHVNAQAYSTMGALGCGAGLALLPTFSASRFWEDARRLGATEVNTVGAMIHILLKTEPRGADREHGIRLTYAALALPEAQHREFEERFGAKMTVGYGMSETTFGTVWPAGAAPRYGTMGTLRQHPRLGVVNRGRVVKDDGSEARDGEPGELWLQNPATMRGYWDDPAKTAEALDGGWLHTGDVVRRDADGFFTFVSRKRDVIRRRGENVAAAEIERVLEAHPSVLEAAAVGVPSELGEEEIVAYVAPRGGHVIDEAELRAWALEWLADFKVPSQIHVRDALPRTPTERIAKHLLK